MARTPAENIDVLRDRIRTSEDITNADIEVLIDFSDRLFLLSTDYSDHRHEKHLRHCTRMAEEVGGLADALDERSADESTHFDDPDAPLWPRKSDSAIGLSYNMASSASSRVPPNAPGFSVR